MEGAVDYRLRALCEEGSCHSALLVDSLGTELPGLLF